MIARHFPMRNLRKSSYSGLVRYLLDEQGKIDRVDAVTVTNCQSETLTMAAIEVEAVQRANTRAKSDKTYHMLISFPVGEVPTPDVLRDIEQTLCAGIGLGDHQRISVVHIDTDNFHLHVAINKIHPVKGTIHEPYQDHNKLNKLAERLEKKHGLQRTNHTPTKTTGEGRAADMERSAGLESFITWVRREVAPKLEAATSWAEFHGVLAEHGLRLRERGAGLVLGTEDGSLHARASLFRCSKTKLDLRFGPREPADPHAPAPSAPQAPLPVQVPPASSYTKAPVKRLDSAPLFGRYLADQGDLAKRKAAAVAAVMTSHRREMDAAGRAWAAQRAAIRLIMRGAVPKKLLYAAARQNFERRVAKEKRAYALRLTAARKDHRRLTWFEWLQAQARRGDRDAMTVLRGADQSTAQRAAHVTKDGAASIRVGTGAIRDDGRRFTIVVEDPAALRVALIRTAQRSGPTVAVTGPDDFRDRLAAIAAISRLPINFADPALESRRRHILETLNGPRPDTTAEDHRTAGGGGAGLGGPGRPAGTGRPERATGDGEVRNVHAREPDTLNVGTNRAGPRPPAPYRMRKLSELPMASVVGLSEVLLPLDLPVGVGKRDAHSDKPMRRPIRDGRRIDETSPSPEPPPTTRPLAPSLEPADRYIAERNAKRATVAGILEHRRHTEADVGPLPYAGTRVVDGQYLALLRRAKQILVVPVTDYSASRLKTVKVGTTVQLYKGGTVAIKSRSRIR